MAESGLIKAMGTVQVARTQSADPAVAASAEAARARIESAYTVAYRKRRNQDEARIRILEACRRPAFAERVEFSKPVGGKTLRGPSVRFAETALRLWENVSVETMVIFEDDFVRRLKVYCTDLESNTTYSKEIVTNKTVERKSAGGDREILGERINSKGEKVFILAATEEETNNKESAAISKSVRNEGLRLIPSDITDEAIAEARKTLKQRDASDPQAAKKALLDAFAAIGVNPKDIEKWLNHSTDQIVPAELEELRGMYRAIQDGESRWIDYIEAKEGEKTKAEQLKDKLRGKQAEAAK